MRLLVSSVDYIFIAPVCGFHCVFLFFMWHKGTSQKLQMWFGWLELQCIVGSIITNTKLSLIWPQLDCVWWSTHGLCIWAYHVCIWPHWRWGHVGRWLWGPPRHSSSRAGCEGGTRRWWHWTVAVGRPFGQAPPLETQRCIASPGSAGE